MDKIVYLYGSARDSATRALRRGTFPREMQIRVGPWVIRPSRRVAVEFVRMVPHMVEILAKMSVGTIQAQRLDSALISKEELLQACTDFHATKALPPPPVVVVSAAPLAVVIEEVVVPVATPAIVPEPTPEPVVVEPIPEAPIPADAEV